jgi:serine protease Do
MNQTMFRAVAGGALAVALLGGGFVLGRADAVHEREPARRVADATPSVAAPAAVANDEPRGTSGRPSFAALVATVDPAVVHIKVTSIVKTGGMDGFPPDAFGDDAPFPGFPFPQRRAPHEGSRQQGAGSGFIIRADGVVLTNNHVVENAKEITVILSDGRELTGQVLGRDPKTDLAVVKIDGHALPVARLGDSDGLKVGDWVVAIGNPFGLNNTVTAGIVSAKGRAIGGPYDDFIQTDASINPGNSGGPLFDESGNVVGINSAIYSQNGGNIGIGFAIPINMAKKLVPELEENGHVTRGWLGVSIQSVTPDMAESFGVEGKHGMLVAGVTPDSPAAKAGLQPGDVVLRYDGKALDAHTALPALVAATPIGTTVPLEIVRDGKTKTVEVTVAKLAEPVETSLAAAGKARLGLRLRDLTPGEREQRDLEAHEGVLVAEVVPDSPAAEAGIEAGNVVLRVNRKPVDSVEALKAEIAKTPEDKAVLLLVRPAGGGDRFVTLAAR